MANILTYIKNYKDKTFAEAEFNEVDNLILSSISYLDFEGILKDTCKYKLNLETVGDKFFSKYTKKELSNNIFSVQAAIKVFKAIYKTNRYKDLLLYNYCYKTANNKQFCAIFIDIDKYLTYISFEGTDDQVSGWREDVEMSYKFPVGSQSEAIRYINKHINPFTKRKYIIGGHSKGGNLSLVASMHANHLIKPKIKGIYMYDAPGLNLKQINSKNYRKVKDKIVRVIPNYSIFGLCYFHERTAIVIKSRRKGLMGHNIINWEVADNEFIKVPLSDFSKKLDKAITEWMSSYNDKQKEMFINDLFDIFNRAEITNVLDIKTKTITKVRTIIKESKKISPESKIVIEEFIKFMVILLKEESSNYISSKIPTLKH